MNDIYLDNTSPITVPEYIQQLQNILEDKCEELEEIMKKWHKVKSEMGIIEKQRNELEALCDDLTGTIEGLGYKV